jgi:uncharacterized cupin superfamily protein
VQALAVPGFYAWSAWQPSRNMFFSSFLLVREDGNIAFDPLPLDERDAREIDDLGGVATILLTNRDHERAAAAMRDRFASRVLCSRREAELFEMTVDGTFDTEALPGITAVPLEGAKTPGEVAFLIQGLATAVVGDAILGTPAGALSFLDAAKLADPQALALSLRRLWNPAVKALLLGDGASLFAGVDDALHDLLASHGGPAIYRLNVADATFIAGDDPTGKYPTQEAEIGELIGARKLGYQLARIPPGARFCPMHSHDTEEELFYVIEGTPSVRLPGGTLALRPGDFVALPVGDRGTHQLLNESAAAALVLLLGNDESDEIVYYPDSMKVLACRRGFLMRADRLDYFDGE